MSVTRSMLEDMGIEEGWIDTIIEAHMETVEGIQADIAKYKGAAEKLPSIQKELDDLKVTADNGWEETAREWEKKYNDLVADNTKKETQAAKEKAYRDLLKDANLTEKGIEKALKYAKWDSIELDGNGSIKDFAAHIESVKDGWSEYIVTTVTTGAPTAHPPGNNAFDRDLGSLSMKDYIAVRSKQR